MAGATVNRKANRTQKAQRPADSSAGAPDAATKLKDALNNVPTKGRALLEMTVQNILYDRKTLIFFGLSLFLLIIPGYWAYSWTPKSPLGTDLFVVIVMLVYLQFIVLYACLLFGASLFSEEEEQKTITYLTSRPVSNFELVIYKYIGFVISVFFMFLIPLLLTFAIIATHTSYDLTSDFMFHLGQFIGLMFVAIAAWGAFFLFLGVLLKKYALIGGLLYALFWETFIANIGTSIKYGTVNFYIRSLAPYNMGLGGTDMMAWGSALASMIGFAVVCLILSWYIQRNKDYN
jgi:ABC-type transport system involved in multi-copper enzyme maturation permease subunit